MFEEADDVWREIPSQVWGGNMGQPSKTNGYICGIRAQILQEEMKMGVVDVSVDAPSSEG